jgi:hypothetical protein
VGYPPLLVQPGGWIISGAAALHCIIVLIGARQENQNIALHPMLSEDTPGSPFLLAAIGGRLPHGTLIGSAALPGCAPVAGEPS